MLKNSYLQGRICWYSCTLKSETLFKNQLHDNFYRKYCQVFQTSFFYRKLRGYCFCNLFPKKLKAWLKTQITILFNLFMKFDVYGQTVLKYLIMSIKRNNRSQIFLKVGALKNFRKIHRETPLLESLFNKVVSLQACNFIKKRLQHRRFALNIAKFLRKTFYRTSLVAAFA